MTTTKKTALQQAKETAQQANHTMERLTHLVVQALAGTGKTFTLVLGLAYLFKPRIWQTVVKELGFDPKPSPQQAAVWQTLDKATYPRRPRTIVYVAFNRSIVNDFEAKYAWLVDALKAEGIHLSFKTCHQLGFAACCKAYKINFRNINKYKTRNLLEEELGVDMREFTRTPANLVLVNAVEALVGHCKLSLTDPTPENLDSLALHHEIEMNGQRDRVFQLVPVILDKSRDPGVCKTVIDFNDQVWLPTVNGLDLFRHDLVLGDEAQDWNHAQQEIILKTGRQFVVCGDTNQAIYGFAGADVDSIPTMANKLGKLGTVVTLPLTQTRRCGKAVVDEARKIVPQFEAHASNPTGRVDWMDRDKAYQSMAEGDMVLCRVNAPLCSVAFQLIKDGRKANIQGRSIGDGLIKLIDKLMGKTKDSVGDLVEAVDDWYHREAQKIAKRKNPSDDAMIALQDRRDCVLAFTEGAVTVQETKDRIRQTFQGKVCPKCGQGYNEEASACFNRSCRKEPLVVPEGVLLSSIHKAKGMEADRVFILKPELMPHPMARTDWARGQEQNLKYVAITRAVENLVFIDE